MKRSEYTVHSNGVFVAGKAAPEHGFFAVKQSMGAHDDGWVYTASRQDLTGMDRS